MVFRQKPSPNNKNTFRFLLGGGGPPFNIRGMRLLFGGGQFLGPHFRKPQIFTLLQGWEVCRCLKHIQVWELRQGSFAQPNMIWRAPACKGREESSCLDSALKQETPRFSVYGLQGTTRMSRICVMNGVRLERGSTQSNFKSQRCLNRAIRTRSDPCGPRGLGLGV